MEPRWQKEWENVYLDRHRACVGGFERFDLWIVSATNYYDDFYSVRIVWGEWNDWDQYCVTNGKLSEGQFHEVGGPTPEELKLIERYLALFVPELGLVMDEEDGT